MIFVRGLSDPTVSPLTTPGFVYFIRGRVTGAVKIGWATKPTVRLRNMQSMSPDILDIVAQKPGTGHDEKALHKRFASHRIHGEWFSPVPEILGEIATTGLHASYSDPRQQSKAQFGPPYCASDDLYMKYARIAVQCLG